VAHPRNLVAYSLLLGAVAGTSVWIQFALRGGTLYWVPTLAAIVYYSLAGWGGLQLLRWHEGAAKVALAAVLPQVIQIQTGRFIYSVVCGPQLRIAIDAFGFDVRAGVGSVVEVGMVASTPRPTFAINVVAILFAFYLRSQSSRSRLTSA
jgi:hypothetical protein